MLFPGIRLCKAKRFRFEHMDLDDLERKLAEASEAVGVEGKKLVATDGVFR